MTIDNFPSLTISAPASFLTSTSDIVAHDAGQRKNLWPSKRTNLTYDKDLFANCLFADIVGLISLMRSAEDQFEFADALIYFHQTWKENCHTPKIIQLSDSICVWSYTHGEALPASQESRAANLSGLVELGASTIRLGLKQGWVLRGGVAHGQCIQAQTRSVISGLPWADAHELEGEQLWAGMALDKSATADIPEEQLRAIPSLTYYEKIPFKSGMVAGWVVNWVNSSVQREDIEMCLDRLVDCSTEKEKDKAEAIKNNTLDFFDARTT